MKNKVISMSKAILYLEKQESKLSEFELEFDNRNYRLCSHNPEFVKKEIMKHTMGIVSFNGREYTSPFELDLTTAFSFEEKDIQKSFAKLNLLTKIFEYNVGYISCTLCPGHIFKDFHAALWHIEYHKESGNKNGCK